jgi:type I restriction enzyme, S subunit
MNPGFPANWAFTILGKVAHVQSGLALSKRALKDPVRVPYLRVANVQEGFLDLSEIKYVEVEQHQLERFRLQEGDVLMTEGGDIDKLGRGDLWRGEIVCCLHQNHVFAVRVNDKLILPEFLNALANSFYGRRYFSMCAKSSTSLASINAKQLRKFPVLLPPLEEQRHICRIVADLDNRWRCTQQLLRNHQEQQRGLRQLLLESEASLAWPWLAMEQVAQVGLGKAEPSLPAEFRYITLSDVNAGVIAPDLALISAQDAPKRARRSVAAGDILMSMVRPNLLGYARIDARYADCIASTGFALLRAHPGVDPGYLYHCLFSNQMQRQIQARVTGSSYPSISLADIASLRLALPSLAKQQRIVSILDGAEREVQLAQRQCEATLLEKKYCLQRLVTGNWRIPGFEADAGKAAKKRRVTV